MIRALFRPYFTKIKVQILVTGNGRLYKCNLNDTKMKLLSVPEGVNLASTRQSGIQDCKQSQRRKKIREQEKS